MMKSTVLALAVVLLPSIAFSSPSGAEKEAAVVMTRGIAATTERTPSQEVLQGMITAVDQSNDRITVRLSSGVVADFRVQDGLIFNAVRYGDQVEMTVESIEGAQTIVGLR
jgi:Cu/Ag efflux protein CusF